MDHPLSKDELLALKERLKTMSVPDLKDFYRTAYWQCTLEIGVPAPEAIQRLVTAWKQLRLRSR